METDLIRYNLRERGRKFRGKERHFNIRAIAKGINSPETQERVKHRDMVGYYGHWPRVKFGLRPREGGITADGVVQAVEPAIVTTHLVAFDDGTIEHKTEFLQTAAGEIAARLFASKTGGFSSAIDESVSEFCGFDYVLEPNYSTNRGYDIAFDGIGEAEIGDIAVLEYNSHLAGMLKLMDCMTQQQARTAEALEHAQLENVQLHSILLTGGASLDSVESTYVRPIVVSRDAAERLQRDIDSFSTATLARIEEAPKEEGAQARTLSNFLSRIRGR